MKSCGTQTYKGLIVNLDFFLTDEYYTFRNLVFWIIQLKNWKVATSANQFPFERLLFCKIYLKAQKVNIIRRKSFSCSVTIQHFYTKSNIKLPARIWQSKEKRTSSYPINSKGYSYMHTAWMVKNECVLHTTLYLQLMYRVHILIKSSKIHKYLMYRTFLKFLIRQFH